MTERLSRQLMSRLLGLGLILVLAALPELLIRVTPAHAESTDVGGPISTDTTWNLAGSPYIVTGDVTVQSGVTLTVEPGVEVRFNASTGLFVQGALRAAGTIGQPIAFTSSSDTPASGQWYGLFFEAGSNDAHNLVDYATVSYAGQALCWISYCSYSTGIGVYDASPTIQHTTVAHSSGDGLWALDASLTLSQDIFEQNSGNGVSVKSTALSLNDSLLQENNSNGLYVLAYVTVLTPTLTGNTIISNSGQAIYLEYIGGAGLPVVISNTLTGNGGFNGVGFGGSLSYSMTWPADYAVPRAVVSNLTINPGAELTVEPGAELRFNTSTGLFVQGALRAAGTASQPITFTTVSDAPVPGQWYGLFFEAGSDDLHNLLDYVTVSDAGQALCWIGTCSYSIGVGVYDASPTIQHTAIVSSAGDGLWALDANLTLNQDTFKQNNGNGVFVKSTALTLSNNLLQQNGSNGLDVFAYVAILTPTLTGNAIISNSGQAIDLEYVSGAGLPVVSGNILVGNSGFNGVAVGGSLNYSMTWPADYAMPRAVVGNLRINPGVELTIEPGAEMRFNTSTGLFVQGALRAAGTPGQPITFTTISDTPAPGQWYGLFFEAGSDDVHTLLDYVTVSDAGQALCWIGTCSYSTSIGVYDASPTIRHTTVAHSSGDGLWALDANLTLNQDTFEQNNGNGLSVVNSSLHIEDGSHRNNGEAGIKLQSSPATIENCSLTGNATFGIENLSATPIVQAQYNWWGQPSGPYNPSTNPDGLGNQVSDGVAYDPWLLFSGIRTPIPLVLGQVLTGTVRQQGFVDYQIGVQPGQNLLVEVTPDPDAANLWVFSRLGSLADWNHFDQRIQPAASAGKYYLPVVNSTGGQLYLSLYGNDVPSAGENYTITVQPVGPTLVGITPSIAGNAGQVTLNLSGLPFVDSMQIQLQKTGQTPITADQVTLESATDLRAHFNLQGAVTGTYDVVAHWPNGSQASLAGAFTISAGTGPRLEASLESPHLVRPDRSYTLWLYYANTGDADITAPLFIVSSPISVPMRLSSQDAFETQSPQVLGVSTGNPIGVLAPGAASRIPIYFHVPPDAGPHQLMDFNLTVMISDTEPIDWAAVEDEVRPLDINSDVWNLLWPNLTAQIGSTWGDYRRTLAADASYLGSLGRVTSNIRDLFRFEVRKALGMNPRAIMAQRLDAFAPAPGLPLQFDLIFPGSLEGRFYLGPLGRGWSHTYDIFLEEQSTGDVLIHWPGSATRLFTYNGAGTYTALPGDTGILTRAGSLFTLIEKDGLVYHFRSDNKLGDEADLNGNQLTFSYNSSGQLVLISHSNGERFALDYNGQGRLAQLTDQIGHATRYSYDVSGEHLITATAPGNHVTAYAYQNPIGQPGDHALLSVTYPDSRHQYFGYDSRGRLSTEHLDGNAEPITYTYDSMSRITVTDANGVATVISPDEVGRPAQSADALRRTLGLQYGADFNLAAVTDRGGQSYQFNYDLRGNVIAAEDPVGNQITLSYDPRFSQVSALVDGRGNHSTFTYDEAGNLTTLTYPDMTQEIITYTVAGSPAVYASRNGAVITYTHNSQGQLLRKDYPDGSWLAYTYDAASNLTSASNVSGTIAMTYDPNTNLLINITYPSGHSFTFSYDQADRRTQRVGDDGYTLNYQYDQAGRLASLTDGSSAELIHYAYDAAGRLVRETKGNGTYTTYVYDAAGQLTQLINYGPTDSVQSRFDYTYDTNGDRTSMTTLDGITTYAYDLIGQLTGVTYPGGRQVVYAYDAAGNRRTVSDNGSPTAYTTNNLNEYTQVGTATYAYEANGNLTSMIDISGTTTYAYDFENRLVSMAEPDGDTWQYTYDALGDRVTVKHNGVLTQYLHDPTGLLDVAAEYNSSGALAAHYVDGLGLVARIDATGQPAYYAFDATGNTRQVSDGAGAVADTYNYDPFGIPLQTSETIPNPFRYVGRFGVIADGSPLNYMRARYYDADLGRFTTTDPIGLTTLRNLNLYAYSLNNPVMLIDPSGKYKIATWSEIGGSYLADLIADAYPDEGFHKIWEIWGRLQNGGEFLVEWHAAKSMADRVHALGVYGLKTLLDVVFPKIPGTGSMVDAWDRLVYDVAYWWFTRDLAKPIVAPMGKATAENLTSGDPNAKVGPTGLGDQRLVSVADNLQYEIDFENVITASVPAQEVIVTDYLDPHLDWTTFRLTEITWGNQVVAIPDHTAVVSTRATIQDYRLLVDKAWWVDVTVELNPLTGRVCWTLRTIDPDTGQLPDDPLAGFLPPNDATGRGAGHVSFTIRSKADAPTGTLLTNTARIVFDTNPAIDTNQVWNTIGVISDLAVTQSAKPNPASVGHALTYSLRVSNSGPDAATGAVITDTLPVSVTPGLVAASQGSCHGTRIVICDLGTIEPAAQVTLTLVVTPTATGVLTNMASVSSTVIEANTIDNSVVVNTAVIEALHYKIFLPLVRRNR